MAAEYSANAIQTVAPGGSVIFTESPVPCNAGLIYHRDESGAFRLASPSAMNCSCRRRCCGSFPTANYQVAFHANIQIPEDGEVEPISLAISIDGQVDPSSIMTYTPAAVEKLGNVGADVIIAVPCICRCSSVGVVNVGTQPIQVQNANIVFDFAGVRQ